MALLRGLLAGIGLTLGWATNPLPLVDLFSAEKNPGQGTLEYVHGGETEKITFGAETGHYVLGMIFTNDTLPENLQNEFKHKEVIQLALGTLAKNANGRVPQFGAATFMVMKGTRPQRVLPLRVPGPSETPLPESGFLLFSSPSLQAQVGDEEKLKGTVFAKGGSIVLSGGSTPRDIQVPLEGKKIPFKMQAMRLDVNATLVTPFQGEEQQLKGQLEFPLYWPEGSQGKKLAKKLAATSFQSKTSLQIPEDPAPLRTLGSKPSSSK